MKKTKKQIIELLKSGNFTLAYHDKEYCCLYEGHHSYDELESEQEIFFFESYDSEGYIPGEVRLLIEALGGKCETT